ncbi:MAG: hypothetical protein VYE22_12750 [Myxococcota bacterium]|nr:hypothetical protein [Myxococcota bacterium]
MRRTTWMMAALAIGLAGCMDTGRSADGLTGISDGGRCEAEWTTTLNLATGGREAVGEVAFAMTDGGVLATITTDPGWEIGDAYLGVGVDGAPPTWVVMNPEPWVTGWMTRIVLRHSLDGLARCGAALKIQVQANARAVGAPGHELASAFGPQDRGQWGWADFRPFCCPPPEEPGCTLTQGFWKNHPEAWPVTSLTIGPHTYDQAQLLALLRTPVRGDASVALAHQLIAAELNVAAGAAPVPAIADAQTWMSAHGGGAMLPYGVRASSPAGRMAVRLNEALTAYNEGRTGPGHCDDRGCADRDVDIDEDIDEDCDEDVDED